MAIGQPRRRWYVLPGQCCRHLLSIEIVGAGNAGCKHKAEAQRGHNPAGEAFFHGDLLRVTPNSPLSPKYIMLGHSRGTMKSTRRSFLGHGSVAAGFLIGGGSLRGAHAAAKVDSAASVVAAAAGKIRGAMQDTIQGRVHAFKGIPYGPSTEGAARFWPPAKPQPWTGVRDALEYGPASPQVPSNLIPESMAQQPKSDADGNEDCLHLNVWSPALGSGKRPVMVWFHGGGYSAGSANWNMYNGGNLAAKQDVVVVTVNHRLNVFGYLYLAELGGGKFAQSSNVGMLDCIAALEWVRDNIADFGGDPGNVTIFGQSGGGGKVSTLLAMPAAKGLIH